MEHEKRRHPRFSTVGRVEAPEICIFPGTLQDVGSGGCRVKFPIHVTIDMEQEYELKILFSQNTMTKEMVLIGQPVYNNGETTSEIGFKLLKTIPNPIAQRSLKTCSAAKLICPPMPSWGP